MRYGSVASHGVAITSALLADSRFRLIYRPHPRTGMVIAAHREADERIRRLIGHANAADPTAGHLVDDSPFGWQLKTADLMIADISAVAYDWLTTAKPLIITEPAEETAVIDPTTFMADLRLVRAEEAGDIVSIVHRALTDPEQIETMRKWCAYYYGDTTPGASMARFLGAVERMIGERDNWIEHDHPVPDDLARIGPVSR
jgi:hypothetical protein